MPDLSHSLSRDEWRDWLGRFERIVLYANASGVAVRSPARGSLAVTFNRFVVPGVDLSNATTLLVLRNARQGIATVRRGAFDGVLAKFGEDGPSRIVRLTAGDRIGSGSDHELPVPYVDLNLTDHFRAWYPAAMPSTGYATASWLASLELDVPIELRGFTGVRSETNKVSYLHDWTFERASLRLLVADGKLIDGNMGGGRLAALATAHPNASSEELTTAYLAALQERMEGNERIADRLMSATRPLRWIAHRARTGKAALRRLASRRTNDYPAERP